MSVLARLSARTAPIRARIEGEPVIVTNIVGSVLGIVVGVGVPITPDLKVAIIGLIGGATTLFARSQVSPVSSPPFPPIPPVAGAQP